MNIGGIDSTYNRVYVSNRANKDEQPFADALEQADNSLNTKVENEDEKKEIADEEETRTEIVVRPDSSKVLMITVTVGDQEVVTSVELAKPTEEVIPGKNITGDVDVKDTRVVASAVMAYENTMSVYSNSVAEND